MNKVSVTGAVSNKHFEKKIREVLERSLSAMGKDNFYLEVFLVTDSEMREISRRSRGKDSATNVLSFEEVESPDFVEVQTKESDHFKRLGEIYLAPNYILERKEDIYRLAIHGLLHLFGYKHEAKSDNINMQKQEDKLWEKISLRD